MRILLIILFLFPTLAYGQVAELEGTSLPYLNSQLRESVRRMNVVESNTLNSFSGILDLDSGGTATALTDPGKDSIYIWDDSETESAFIELSTDGTLGGNSDVAVPTEKAVKTYADNIPTGSSLISRTPWTNTTASETIAITAGNVYKVVVRATPNANAEIGIQINGDSTGAYFYNHTGSYGTTPTAIAAGSATSTFIPFTAVGVNADAGESVLADFLLTTEFSDTSKIYAIGQSQMMRSGALQFINFVGYRNLTATTFQIYSNANTTGEVLLYLMLTS